jgi:hypothetical protein
MHLVLWAKWLNQPDDMPIAVYKTKKGKEIYLTGNKIAKLLQKAIKEVQPDTTLDKLKRYSAHSLRFGPAYCSKRQESCQIISRAPMAG